MKNKIVNYVVIISILFIAYYLNDWGHLNVINKKYINVINWLGFFVSAPFFIYAVAKNKRDIVYMTITFLMTFIYSMALSVHYYLTDNKIWGILFFIISVIILIASELWLFEVLGKVISWILNSKLFITIKFIGIIIFMIFVGIVWGLAELKNTNITESHTSEIQD